MTPISIRRAFDADLDRVMEDMSQEAAEAEQLPSGIVSVLVIAALFILPMWAIWVWL